MSARGGLRAATALLLLAAALRLTGITFGQPIPAYAPQDAALNTIHADTPLHPDEFLFVQRPLRMLLTGDLNPKFFHNPSFLINLNLTVFWLTGERDALSWEGREAFGARREAPFRLYVTARVFSAWGGVLAVAATYAAARRLAGHFAGIAAAAVVTFSLPMVQHAHYATTSSLAAGFSAVCIWASFTVLWRFRPLMFVLAGLAAGLAAGSRYNAAAVSIVVCCVGLGWLWQQRTLRRLAWVLAGWAAFPLAFLFTTPHVISDTAFWWSEFQYITNQYIGYEANPLNVGPWVGLGYELRYLAVFGVGVTAAAAGVWSVWRAATTRRGRGVALLLAYLLPYAYVVLRTIRPLGADQMLVPIIPAVAVLAGVGVGGVRRRWVQWALLMVLVAPLVVPAGQVVRLLATPDTRYDVQAWAWEHLPEGAHVHLYGPYNVPLDETRYTVTRTYGTGEVRSIAGLRADGVDYVIVSDAWLRHFERTRYIDPNYAEAVLAPVRSFEARLVRLYAVPRPVIVGVNDPMHTASYWHHPGLSVYCLTAAACAAAG